MNHLLDLMTAENVIFEMKSNKKEGVIDELVMHGVQIGLFDKSDATEIIDSLLNREKTMSTGIGSGVAIPHCSIHLVKELKVVVGLSKSGIEFEAIDKMPVHIFVLLVVPKDKFQDHIKTLALIAKTLNHKEERDKLVDSTNFEDIKAVFAGT